MLRCHGVWRWYCQLSTGSSFRSSIPKYVALKAAYVLIDHRCGCLPFRIYAAIQDLTVAGKRTHARTHTTITTTTTTQNHSKHVEVFNCNCTEYTSYYSDYGNEFTAICLLCLLLLFICSFAHPANKTPTPSQETPTPSHETPHNQSKNNITHTHPTHKMHTQSLKTTPEHSQH